MEIIHLRAILYITVRIMYIMLNNDWRMMRGKSQTTKNPKSHSYSTITLLTGSVTGSSRVMDNTLVVMPTFIHSEYGNTGI